MRKRIEEVFDSRWKLSILAVILFMIIVTPQLIFRTDTHTYLIKDATIEQVEQITQADPNGRVWYDSASLLAQGSNLLEVTFRTRMLESHKVAEYLDSIGVEYSELK